jgi:hypothetical protein
LVTDRTRFESEALYARLIEAMNTSIGFVVLLCSVIFFKKENLKLSVELRCLVDKKRMDKRLAMDYVFSLLCLCYM